MTPHIAARERWTVRLHDLQPTTDSLRADVLRGLSAPHRMLPPKYFYDDAGAALFERICELEEYYPTRTELGILQQHVGAMAHAIGAGARIVEFGSGSGLKTRLLLRHLERPAAYAPVDISRAQLVAFARSVAAEFPHIAVTPVCADYTHPFTLPSGHGSTPGAIQRTVAFFPGSSIGNFEPVTAISFLYRVRMLCGDDGGLLIGADLHKPRAVLERAYNDDAGVTAAFNLNLLARINRECDADFDTHAFRHHAFYDETHHRIEMRLQAVRACTVTIPGEDHAQSHAFRFRAGDYITTEYSHKYSPASFTALAAAAGWRVAQSWTDDQQWFGVWLLERG